LFIHFLKGEIPDVLNYIHELYIIQNIFSHQETGNNISFERDKQVSRWCKLYGINWKQFPDKGIIRGLQHREGWLANFMEYVQAPIVEPMIKRLRPAFLEDHPFEVKSFQQLFWSAPLFVRNFQPGGPMPGNFYLQTFLQERSVHYQKYIEEPGMSRISSSRLSPYLAYGNLSLRQVWQAMERRMQQAHVLRKQLEFFQKRLVWHSHYIQKFETEPGLEFSNMNGGFDDIQQEINEEKINAWKEGKTGFPLVDAGMRCLHETGYLNFSMRGMLVSFFCHHLWQPWQIAAPHLAKLFLDYEPGVHYTHIQKQAGVTGVDRFHIYHPVKQSKEKDQGGEFIQKWAPALRHLPTPFFFEPWKLDKVDQQQLKCVIGKDYPFPIVDLDKTGKHAKDTLAEIQKSIKVKELNASIRERLVCAEVNEEKDL
jgi:deoxyribodipyrimidine photo-lyase